MESTKKQEHKKFKHKKSDKNNKNSEPGKTNRNLKAFALQSAVKAERLFRRKQDIIAKREHAPQVDRTPIEPPPSVVAVVGPPKVGKTTLIRCLVRNYTRQNISQIKGPITVVSGKNRRITFMECNNDINSMIDIAKIADLVLLMVDASFGFEMETFEFLNICQSHGFPRIMGVLSHLDVITNPKKMRRIKKQLKHRFWTEIYAGAKLFYLSKLLHNEYLRNEVHNIARFISVMKFRPLQWVTNHPYLLVDRVEDITNPEDIRKNSKCNRKVCLFGYSRGANFKSNNDVHIPGCGDFTVSNVSFIPDPCPLPNKEKREKRRSLNEKEKCIYAPMSGVGGIVFDKDAIYIDLGGSHSYKDDQDATEKEEEQIVASINQNDGTLDHKLASTEMQLFSNTRPVSYSDAQIFDDDNVPESRIRRKVTFKDDDLNSDNDEDDEDSNDEDDDFDEELNNEISDDDENEMVDENYVFDSSDEDANGNTPDDNDVEVSDWKDDLHRKASEAFYERIARVDNVQKLVYGNLTLEEDEPNDGSDVSDGLFKLIQLKENSVHNMKFTLNSVECTKFPGDLLIDFTSDLKRKFIRDCFVTGKWDKDEDASKLLANDQAKETGDDDDDESLYGDFEDCETNQVFKGQHNEEEEDEEMDQTDNDEEESENDEEDDIDKIRKKKMQQKERFDDDYDNLKSTDVINPEEKSLFDLEKEKMKEQSEVFIIKLICMTYY